MIAGIDLGTSSVKIVCVDQDGNIQKASCRYRENTVDEWLWAIREAFRRLDTQKITAISLSSQVGTYIMEDELLSWRASGGEEELKELLETFSTGEFVTEISMIHPSLISYPIPRIHYLQKRTEPDHIPQAICQPKECICRYLTGKNVSDQYSWRGLANQETGKYSQKFLNYLGISDKVLPTLKSPFKTAGRLLEEPANECGLNPGIPVYTGCNDFYASLLGMGIVKPGDCFDVTGTSEHMGMITEKLVWDDQVIASPYLNGYVAYGVTASSGGSLDFGLRELDLINVSYEKYQNKKKLPIFLPYVNGERAPIYDSQARGVFFGIEADTTREDMAYAVMEGVAFSTWHIMEKLSKENIRQIICAGGATRNKNLLKLKADLFGVPFVRAKEEDTSGYGACLIGAVGEEWYPDIETAVKNMCSYDSAIIPQENRKLQDRFQLYKNIYTDLKQEFKEFRRISQ